MLAKERRAGRAGDATVETAIVAVAVIAVVIGVRIIGVCIAAERRGGDCAGRTDGTADHARRYVSWPETVMIDAGLILMADRPCSCGRIPRHGRRCDCSREDCGCG